MGEYMDRQLEYIGLKLDAAIDLAEQNGVPWRVSSFDGDEQPPAEDFNYRRINFDTEQDFVASITFG